MPSLEETETAVLQLETMVIGVAFLTGTSTRLTPRSACAQDISDLRATRIASNSLQNDVNNLRRVVERAPPAEPESKIWAFVGHQGRRVLVDRRAPEVSRWGSNSARSLWPRSPRRPCLCRALLPLLTLSLTLAVTLAVTLT